MLLGAPAARSVAFFVTVECFAPPVKGCLGLVAEGRKRFFQKNDIFSIRPRVTPRFGGFSFENNKNGTSHDIRLRVVFSEFGRILTYPQIQLRIL